MSILNSFDYIAALSPALRHAVSNGETDPYRWKIVDGKLTDSETGERWYEEDKDDEELENEAIDAWLKNIECRQLIPAKDLRLLMSDYEKMWQDYGFADIKDLRISNIHDSG